MGRKAALNIVTIRLVDRLMAGQRPMGLKQIAHACGVSVRTLYQAYKRKGVYATYPKRKKKR